MQITKTGTVNLFTSSVLVAKVVLPFKNSFVSLMKYKNKKQMNKDMKTIPFNNFFKT